MKSCWLVAGSAMLGMVFIVASPPPAGAVACGDVLAGPGSFRLEQDLVCSTTTALVVRDGATLDLGGHTVTCADLDNGIAVAGTGARLLNGTDHERGRDRKSTRLNSSHLGISYAVF